MSDNIQQMIVDLLNQSSIYGKDAMRVQNLRHVQELILRKDPTLLEYFLDEVLAFQTDKSVEVKKTIISFIEEACQLNPQIIIKVVDNLCFLLHDDNLFVRKKLLLSLIPIYKSTIIWLAKIPSSIDQTVQHMWRTMMDIKDHIITQLNDNNAGFCLAVLKFIEMLVIIFIQHEQDFPENVTGILSRNQCKQDEKDLIEKLTTFVLSQQSSHVQLIAAIESLTSITRYRIDYLRQILSTLKVLHANLSTSFTDSQINEIHKMMKLKLFNLLKFSIPSDSQSEMINFLTNLGCTQSEIDKCLPKKSSESKRKSAMNADTQMSKKPKRIDENSNQHDPIKPIPLNKVHQSSRQQQTVTDLVGKLSIENVVDLVLASMHSLPETIPVSFQSTYIPIKDAGSTAQIEYLARLLSNQLIAAGHDSVKPLQQANRNIADDNKLSSTSTKKTKSHKLFNAVKPIEHHERQRMSIDSFNRILDAKDQLEKVHLHHIHQRIVLSLVYRFEESFRDIFREYLLADIHQRYDLIFAWIYREYARANGYLINSRTHQRKDYTRYDHLLCQILEYLQNNDSDLFSRLLKNVPFVTNNILLIVERYCQNENSSDVGTKLLHHLIVHRIPIRDKCLNILLNLAQSENNSIKKNAIRIVKILYDRTEFRQAIATCYGKILSTRNTKR